MKRLTGWKLILIVAAIASLGISVYESNTSEAAPMLKEVAQACYIVAIVCFCFAYIFPLVRKREE